MVPLFILKLRTERLQSSLILLFSSHHKDWEDPHCLLIILSTKCKFVPSKPESGVNSCLPVYKAFFCRKKELKNCWFLPSFLWNLHHCLPLCKSDPSVRAVLPSCDALTLLPGMCFTLLHDLVKYFCFQAGTDWKDTPMLFHGTVIHSHHHCATSAYSSAGKAWSLDSLSSIFFFLQMQVLPYLFPSCSGTE